MIGGIGALLCKGEGKELLVDYDDILDLHLFICTHGTFISRQQE